MATRFTSVWNWSAFSKWSTVYTGVLLWEISTESFYVMNVLHLKKHQKCKKSKTIISTLKDKPIVFFLIHNFIFLSVNIKKFSFTKNFNPMWPCSALCGSLRDLVSWEMNSEHHYTYYIRVQTNGWGIEAFKTFRILISSTF